MHRDPASSLYGKKEEEGSEDDLVHGFIVFIDKVMTIISKTIAKKRNGEKCKLK
jgi:hypothetical protein